ncbi:MAG TPA: hypothetical protein VIT20_01045, partial [Propionibacteriaceae bacterium]
MDTKGRHRRTVRLACVIVTVAASLGLLAPTQAGASCAGPQVALAQAGTPLVPRRVGSGDQERILFDVTRGQPLVVVASNLT